MRMKEKFAGLAGKCWAYQEVMEVYTSGTCRNSNLLSKRSNAGEY